MRISNTSERLKELMEKRDLKQADILRLCQPYCEKYGEKIGKPYISQWVNGVNEPNQRKLYILGEALGVSEPWLMGYDVPMEKHTFVEVKNDSWNEEFFDNSSTKSVSRTSTRGNADQEEELLYYFNSLPSEEDKKRVLRMMKSFVESAKEDITNNCG